MTYRTAGCRLLAASGLVTAVLAAQVLAPGPAHALPTGVPPVVQRTSAGVTADALPTVQVDGVVWSQAIIGNTVYAAGDFTGAWAAGADPATAKPRRNLLAFSLSSGRLRSAFVPAALDGQVKTVAVSADQETIYVGGDFTKVGTATRLRFAAFDAETGALRPMAPAFNSRVNAITVIGSKVYVGGWFTRVGTTARSRLASVSASTGKLNSWAPVASEGVNALVATPDKTKIIAGGIFTKLNSTTALGMGALDATTGSTKSWKINTVVKNSGQKAAIVSLAADADTVYGSAYGYGGGNFEGSFAASPADGAVRWLQDCHGDTYGVAPIGNTVYTVGHAHHCTNIGGFPDTNPRSKWYRALAVTKAAAGTVARNNQTSSAYYGNFEGRPAPSLVNWFPDLTAGTYTNMGQAAWSVVGNASYVVAGGEFTAVNGTPQRGLVRFAVPAVTGNPVEQGPQLDDESVAPTPVVGADGRVSVSWRTNSDRDDRKLVYEVLRDGEVVAPARVKSSSFWDRPTLTWTDPGTAPGTTYRYSIRVSDRDGNTEISPETAVTVPAPGTDPEPDPEPQPEPAPAGG